MSSKDPNKTRTIHSKSNKMKQMKLLKKYVTFLQKYQIGLEESMYESESVFYRVDLLYYIFKK